MKALAHLNRESRRRPDSARVGERNPRLVSIIEGPTAMQTPSKYFFLVATAALTLPAAASAEDYRQPQRYQDQRDYRQDDRYADQYDRRDDRYDRRRGGSDQALHDEVHEVLEQELGAVGSRIAITVHHGQVTLSGTVPDSRARRIAHDAAHDVPGVRGVTMSRLYAGRRRY